MELEMVTWQIRLKYKNDRFIVNGCYRDNNPTRPTIVKITMNGSDWSWTNFQKLAPVNFYPEKEGNQVIDTINEYVENLF